MLNYINSRLNIGSITHYSNGVSETGVASNRHKLREDVRCNTMFSMLLCKYRRRSVSRNGRTVLGLFDGSNYNLHPEAVFSRLAHAPLLPSQIIIRKSYRTLAEIKIKAYVPAAL